MATVEFHVETSRYLLEQADHDFFAGDIRQASGKGWDAVAHAVKAIAQQRGWSYECHSDLYRAADRITNEMRQPGIMDLFHVANGLHVNFYEGWLTEDFVKDGLDNVRELLDLLERILPHGYTARDGSTTNGMRAMATVEFHVETSQYMLEQADREFRAGDVLQASEKGWGAVAHRLKAIAEERGWRHGRHGDLFTAARRISAELGQPRIRTLFRYVNSLHVNFYEGWLSDDEVEESLEEARELLTMLETVPLNGQR